MFLPRGALLALLPLCAFTVDSQQAPSDSAKAQATFRANVRVVLVDVVVTKGMGEPVIGLPKEDFQAFEDGQPQTIASFEEHAGIPDVPALSRRAQLPQNSFSNLPLVKTGDTANVLLLDSLNTPLPDQSYVHGEMLKYIREIQPGTRLAIFTLGEQLRFVQGFTSDASILSAALKGKKAGGNPSLSPLLMAGADTDANQVLLEEIQGVPGTAAAAAGLQQFLHQTVSFQDDVRARTTLEAMQQLARYLGGFPGRKNVIWFSSSFPISLYNAVTQKDVVETANLLSAAQVAIYPIQASGLATDPHYDFTNQQPPHIGPGQTVEQVHTQYQNQDLQRGQIERARTFGYMDLLADQTGGEALYNQNGLDESVAQVLKQGTHYYTLSYTPANHDMDGELRKIEVKVSGGKYHLAYRRGYYATEELLSPTAHAAPAGDPLRPLMDHGAPDATEILYTVHLTQSSPPADSSRAGDNANLQGPVTRYKVEFTVSADRLLLQPGVDSVWRGNLEATLVGYDRDGKALNWMVRNLQLAIPKDRYAAAQANGIPFSLEIDLPAADIYLRSGVYDMGASRAGTLEIPLNAVVAQK
ncbi:MAG TPA: VWA domain-containing protein [Verrucomicrobiae bacterium]|nr:VWA domain-containing protein [Verrucomicrobiae bacterium]